jgi:hypothetical protein
MASLNDLVDLPKQITSWEEGKGFRGAYGIEAERALVKDVRTLLSLSIQQASALEDSQARAEELMSRLPTSQTDDLEQEDTSHETPLEAAARADRKARRQAKLARAALQDEVMNAYSAGISKTVLSDVSGMTRQTIDRLLGVWERRKSSPSAEEEV